MPITEDDINSLSDKELEYIDKKLDKKIENKKIQEAREDPNAFMEYVMRDDDGNPIEQADIHREWQYLFLEEKTLLLEAPRDHGKTTQYLGFLLWKIGKDPNIRIKIVCNSDDNATKRVGEIKEYIEDSKEYRKVFPDVKPRRGHWKAHSIKVTRESRSKEPTVEARGVFSSSTGDRADLVVYDDICDEKVLQEPKTRERIKQVKRNVWDNVLTPDGEEKYIATRWHEDDLTGELEESEAYSTDIYRINENLDPIWPAEWPKERLKERRAKIGPRAFDRAYRNMPVSADEQLFDKSILTRLTGSYEPVKMKERHPVVIGIDFARSQSSRASRTVIFVTAVPGKNQRRVIDIRLGKWGAVKKVEEIINLWQYYKPICVMAENNSMQQDLIEIIQNLSEQRHYELEKVIEGAYTGKQKMDLEEGVPALQGEIRMGKWKAPYNLKEHKKDCGIDTCGWCLWYDELTSFPVGKSDDIVMANWLCMKGIWEHDHKLGSSNTDQAENIEEFLRRNGEIQNQDMLRGVVDKSVFH